MKILQLSQFYDPVIGGEERHVGTLSRSLVARGHDVTLLTYATIGDEGESMDRGVRVVRVRPLAARVPGLYSEPTWPHAMPIPDPAIARAISAEIVRRRPDVAHAHNWIVNSALGATRRHRVPLVQSLHDYGQVCATQRLMYLRETNCDGPAPRKCLTCSAEKFGWVRGTATVLGNGFMSRRRHSNVEQFVSVSGAVATGVSNVTKRPHVTSPVTSAVIPNFIPDEEIEGEIPPFDPSAPLVFVGDLSRDKGVHILLDAYGSIPDAPPLQLIGRITPETPSTMPAGATALGPMPHADVIAHVRQGQVLFAPSTWREPCPTVVLEGMAAGRPVIGSAMGGITDMIVDGETGFLVPPSDPAPLADAIRKLLADPRRARDMGRAGRERVKTFTVSAVVERLEAVYGNLANAKG